MRQWREAEAPCGGGGASRRRPVGAVQGGSEAVRRRRGAEAPCGGGGASRRRPVGAVRGGSEAVRRRRGAEAPCGCGGASRRGPVGALRGRRVAEAPCGGGGASRRHPATAGLFPLDDVEEFGYNCEARFMWLVQRKKKVHTFKKIKQTVTYAAEVTAFVENSKLKKIVGVKKELMLWLSVVEV